VKFFWGMKIFVLGLMVWLYYDFNNTFVIGDNIELILDYRLKFIYLGCVMAAIECAHVLYRSYKSVKRELLKFEMSQPTNPEMIKLWKRLSLWIKSPAVKVK
jgi:hypothetical protein